jgi:hypothetical protein
MSMKEGGPAPTVPENSQQWAGMEGHIAFHLIERHADNWSDIDRMMKEWLAANSVPSPVAIPEGMPSLDPDLLRSFNRFCETCEDFGADGYDVKPEKMVALAEFGVVRKVRGSVYETTAIGNWLRETLTASPPSPPSQPVESAKCGCGQAHRAVCSYPFSQERNIDIPDYCGNSVGGGRICAHPRACHPSTGEERGGNG